MPHDRTHGGGRVSGDETVKEKKRWSRELGQGKSEFQFPLIY